MLVVCFLMESNVERDTMRNLNKIWISFSASTKHYQDVMMAKLNKQQLALLKEIPADQLMQIICDIAEDNGQAKSFLINKYLLTPEESLKKAEAEYKRVIKTKRFYDYYEAAIFF